MRKKFSVNLIFLLAVNLLIKPLYIFGVEVPVQNTVGAHDYGLYFSLFNFTMFFQILLELGLTNLVRRDISEYRQLAGKYFKYLLSLKIIILPIYIFVVFIIAGLIGYNKQRYILLIYCIVIQTGTSFILFIRAMLAGYGAYKADSLLSVIDKFVLLIICGVQLYFFDRSSFTIYAFLNSYVLSVFIALALGVILMWINGIKIVLKLRKVYLRSFIKKAMPYALITFLMSAYSRLDAVYLERLLPDGAYQAGVYAAGFRLLDAYLMFALLFANLGLPMLAAIGKDTASKVQLFRFILNLLMAPTIIAGVLGWFFRYEISNLIYHHTEYIWYTTIGILLLGMIPIGFSMIAGMAVLTTGKLRELNFLFACSILINVVLNFYLIPKYFAVGAAVSAFLVNCFIAIAQFILFYRLLKIPIDLILSGRILVFLCISVFIAFQVNNLGYSWEYRFGISAALMGFFAFVLGIIPLRWLRTYFTNKVK